MKKTGWTLKHTTMSQTKYQGQLQEARRSNARTTEKTLKERLKRLEELRAQQADTWNFEKTTFWCLNWDVVVSLFLATMLGILSFLKYFYWALGAAG